MLRIGRLEPFFDYNEEWPLTEIFLKRSARHITYHPSSQTYTLISSSSIPFDIARAQYVAAVLSGVIDENIKEHEEAEPLNEAQIKRELEERKKKENIEKATTGGSFKVTAVDFSQFEPSQRGKKSVLEILFQFSFFFFLIFFFFFFFLNSFIIILLRVYEKWSEQINGNFLLLLLFHNVIFLLAFFKILHCSGHP